MKAYGGECVYAVEIDKQAAQVYEANWGHTAARRRHQGRRRRPRHHERPRARRPLRRLPLPAVLQVRRAARHGRDAGTLFFNIASIIKAHHPKIVLLENVRNLIGPRHEHEWEVIIETLRERGLPRLRRGRDLLAPPVLPPTGGRPQVRERVFITATHAPDGCRRSERGGPAPVASMSDRFPKSPTLDFVWNPERPTPARRVVRAAQLTEGWHLEDLLDDSHNIPGCDLSDAETHWINAWDTVRPDHASPDGRTDTFPATRSGLTPGSTSPR